jgi:UDP-N-acetylmuramoyl-L-alanyl-D-glutamate--2,6-diaminopimelate ligase
MPLAGGIFTNLTGDHLDYHHTFEDYYAAKRRLFDECLVAGGTAVVNVEDAYGQRLCDELRQDRRVRALSVGETDRALARISQVETGLDGTRFCLSLAGAELGIESPLIGRHNVMNLAQSAALAWALGVPDGAIVEACRECAGAPGRLQAVPSPSGFVAYVDYAHTDDALENVLNALRALEPKRILVVFGCGGDRDTTKRPRMGEVAARLGDVLFVTSDNPRTEDAETILDHIEAGIPSTRPRIRLVDRRAAIRAAVAQAGPGDVILVAGKGHEDYQEVNGTKHHFDDVEEVRAAIADLSP